MPKDTLQHRMYNFGLAQAIATLGESKLGMSPVLPATVDPSAGDVLGATHLNNFVRYVEYVHGLLASGSEPFCGVSGKNDSVGGEWGRWYFTYGGVPKLYNDFSGASSNVYVQNNSGEETFSPAYANPLTLTGGYTLGNRYYVRFVVAAAQTSRVSYIAMSQPQSFTYAAPVTFTNGNTSAVSDFTGLSNALAYLKAIAEMPRGTFKGQSMTIPGASTIIWNGSFVYNGLNSLNIIGGITVPNGTTSMVLHIVDDDGTNDRTVATITSGNFTTPIAIGALSPALSLARWYRIYVEASSTGTPTCAVSKLYFSGSKNLSPMPPRWLPGQFVYGSTNDPRMQYLTDAVVALKAIAYFLNISSFDRGVHFPAPDTSVPATVAGVTNPTFLDFRRVRHSRWLHYLPTAAGESGNLVYAADTGDSAALADNNGDGTWNVFDLDTLPLCPVGYTYKVTAVKACYESFSSSG